MINLHTYELTLEHLGQAVKTDPLSLVNACESAYSAEIEEITSELVQSGTKILLLAGPSSSGKTTTAKLICEALERAGHHAFTVSLDDFFYDREDIRTGTCGTTDFESPEAINIPLLKQTVSTLLEEGTAKMPVFHFVEGVREDSAYEVSLKFGDVLVVEGLHALNPLITACFPENCLKKAFISVNTGIKNEDGETVFNRREARFFRRLIRDYQFRGSSVENTFNMWKNVIAGEEKFLFPYKHSADFYIDSFHPYELCLYKNIAVSLLEELPETHPDVATAKQYATRMKLFPSLDLFYLPNHSLICEFIQP